VIGAAQQLRPPVADVHIARAELVDRVADALHAGSVVLVADAGFGKTSVLERALAGRGPCVWIRCAPGQSDGRLDLDLLAAARPVVPELGRHLGELLTALASANGPVGGIEALLGTLQEVLTKRLHVVIEDAERLAGRPASMAALERLLQAGTTLGVAVASRRPLPIGLAKLRATGRLTELGPGDLAFDADECDEYLRLRWGRTPSSEEIAAIMAATEGWPLGMALGVTDDGGDPPVRASRELARFLDEEVLDRLGPELRDAILATSATTAIDQVVLDELDLDDDFLNRAYAAGLQLRQIDAATERYAYPPIVRAVLRDRLAKRSPDGLHELHARIGKALVEAGRDRAALDHFVAAKRWPDALAALSRHGAALGGEPKSVLRRWADALPPEVATDPAALLLAGHVARTEGDHGGATACWREALAGFDGNDDRRGLWAARLALARPLAQAGAWAEVIALADGFDADEPDHDGAAAAAVGYHAAIASAARGEPEAARAIAGRLAEHPRGDEMTAARVTWEWHWQVPAGAFGEVEAGCAATIGAFGADDWLDRRGQSLVVAALTLGDQGRDDEALGVWRDVEAHAAQQQPRLADTARRFRALLYARHRRSRQAEQELAGRAASAEAAYAAALAEAHLAAQRGDAEQALAAVGRALEQTETAALLDRHRAVMEVAPVLAEVGAVAEAEALVDTTLADFDARYPGDAGRYARALLLAVRATLRWAAGDDDAAVEELRRAWETAGDTVAAVLRRTWRGVEPLLAPALERDVLEPEATLRAVAQARRGGEPLLRFTDHPTPAVRALAIRFAAESGRPELPVRLQALADDPDPDVSATAEATARRLQREPPALRVQLLGGWRLWRGAWLTDDAAWGRRIALRLVRLLVVRRPEPVLEEELLEAFWPEKPAEAARHSLQTAVSDARRTLDLPGSTESVIEVRERAYRMRMRDADTVDTEAFDHAAVAALDHDGPDRRALLARAEELWDGEPLPEERFADWTAEWRERLTDHYSAVLSALAAEHLASADVPAAAATARRLVGLDPLNEAGHRLLMTAHARAGRRSNSLRQYLQCREALVETLGVEPAQETSDLQRRILAGEAV
jgi:LuxR family transcriptional regulator, maltose regulon positive regulatory protein